MKLEDLLRLQEEAAQSHVAKLAGVSSPPAKSEWLSTDEVMKIANLCDYAADVIKVAEARRPSRRTKISSYQSATTTPVREQADVLSSLLKTASTVEKAEQKPQSAAALKKLASLLKMARQRQETTTVEKTAADKAKRQQTAPTDSPQKKTAEMGPVDVSEPKVDIPVGSTGLAEARAVLAKIAETGCTCNGEGTCSYCRTKEAFARNIGEEPGKPRVYNENGEEPDAATLAIRT